jgi:hypothetical protein
MNPNFQEIPSMGAYSFSPGTSTAAVGYSNLTQQLPPWSIAGTQISSSFPSRFAEISEGPKMSNERRRIVQVYICDTNENIPLEKSLIYKGEQKLTELDDQELYYEIDVKFVLDKHNAERIKIIDKKLSRTSGRDVFLDVAKVRDLKFLVTTLAEF